MAQCMTCGNDYEQTFTVTLKGKTWVFDCFECAVHKLAPVCEGCGCRILGHGVQSGEKLYCGAHCARAAGVAGLATHVENKQGRVAL